MTNLPGAIWRRWAITDASSREPAATKDDAAARRERLPAARQRQPAHGPRRPSLHIRRLRDEIHGHKLRADAKSRPHGPSP
jgi:hypothetical protein